MLYSQVQLNKTDQIQKVFDYLQQIFPFMSESDILKFLLSQEYTQYEKQENEVLEKLKIFFQI